MFMWVFAHFWMIYLCLDINRIAMTKKISKREQEVLQLIAWEHNYHEIAKALYISTNTVKSHRRSLFEKLGAKNSAGLVRRAFEAGLIQSPPTL